MQRMFNLDKWQRLEGSKSVEFLAERPRTVRFEVNAPSKTGLWVVPGADPDGECFFLALVEGRDTVMFSADGPFSLLADADVFIFTADGDDVSVQVEAPESFTRIVERRARNHDLERVMYVAQQNTERMLAQQRMEFERIVSARQSASASVAAGANVSADAGGASVQGGASGSPAEPAPAAAAGGGGGGSAAPS